MTIHLRLYIITQLISRSVALPFYKIKNRNDNTGKRITERIESK
jgi:hypothetical protein